MTKDEALRLALEALEDLGYHHHDCPQWPTFVEPANYPKCNCGYDQAITAIKAALLSRSDGEAKDEPVSWKLVPIEPTDEMLKAMDECSTEGYDERLYAGYAASVYMAAVDAAPTPPKRTWVWLTNEEHMQLAEEWGCLSADWVFYAAAVERKIKERNT